MLQSMGSQRAGHDLPTEQQLLSKFFAVGSGELKEWQPMDVEMPSLQLPTDISSWSRVQSHSQCLLSQSGI